MKIRLIVAFCVFLTLTTKFAASIPQTGENSYCADGGTWVGPATDGGAALPQHCIQTDLAHTPSPGSVISVPPGADLNQYLAQAQCGDVLQLAPAQYGGFMLPAKNCDSGHWIRIQTSATDGLPPEGQRISPCAAGVQSLPGRPAYSCPNPQQLMATISALPAPDVTAAPGANFYRIGPGIELTRPNSSDYSARLVDLGGGDHIIFDRVWVHGTENAAETNSGFNLTGATNVAVISSYLNDFKCIAARIGSCTDARGFGGGDDAAGLPEGTWKIYNNFIEASGENIIFGGAKRGTTTPPDIEIRQNHFYKVPSWNRNDPNYAPPSLRSRGYIVKNLFELKNAQRVLLEGNRMEYSWGGYSQMGFAIVLTPRGRWGAVEDITIRYNYISHVGTGLQIDASRSCTPRRRHRERCKDGSGPVKDSAGMARLSVHDNLVDDVNATYYLGGGSMAQVSSALRYNPPLNHVVLDHNTVVTDGIEGKILSMGTFRNNPQPKMGPFTFTNNIVRAGTHNGIWQVGRPLACVEDMQPIPTFSNCFTQFDVSGNLVVGWGAVSPGPAWPQGNQAPADYSTVFVNPLLSGGDYHVLPPYQNAGTDGKDPGADIDGIGQYMLAAD
ncbi:MAG: hypothetical protein LAO23_10145 [Acidobacteriia bacterium]|nr:hypothetical protein [Terriglobia bacterium]